MLGTALVWKTNLESSSCVGFFVLFCFFLPYLFLQLLLK